MSSFHSLKIARVDRLTPEAVRITFAIPEALQSQFAFIPGQYITVKKDFGGTEVRRSYSICSSVSSGDLAIGVKEVEGGTFSVYANQRLKAGDTLEVHPPEGRFTFQAENGRSGWVAAFAAGSGITPIMSIIQEVLEKSSQNVLLVYGNKSAERTMFREELMALKNTFGERLKLQLFFSREQDPEAEFGRIEKSTVNYLLKKTFPEVTIERAYLCGPHGMIETVRETLTARGLEAGKIFAELFTSSEVEPSVTPDQIPEGKTKIKVIVDETVHEFVMDRKQRVLDAVLAREIDAPHSCQGGICSSCIARVTGGKATMVKNQILTDSEVAEGLILTCQALSQSASLEVDYDDV